MFNSQPEISWNHEIETPKGTSSNKIVSKQPVKVVIIDETDPLSRCYKVLIGILLVILTVLALQTLAG